MGVLLFSFFAKKTKSKNYFKVRECSILLWKSNINIMNIRSIKIKAIALTLLIATILTFFTIEYLAEYGWTVFTFIPFVMGFLPVYMVGRKKTLSRWQSYKLGFLTLFIGFLLLLIFAYEGIGCILMASPIMLIFIFIGAHLAFIMQNGNLGKPKNISVFLIFTAVIFMSFDAVNEPTNLIPVKTRVIVNAPIGEVWNNVVTFNQIDEPTEWIFKMGIAYPIDATIQGKGVGAIRHCNFTTGSFVEPITTWDEPHLLQFDVKEQPIPMHEYNPFWEIHPPHLDGYFRSYKGQFALEEINANQTELEGTTWYKVDIMPGIYWQAWSDFIVHQIHDRVLNHIKKESEK